MINKYCIFSISHLTIWNFTVRFTTSWMVSVMLNVNGEMYLKRFPLQCSRITEILNSGKVSSLICLRPVGIWHDQSASFKEEEAGWDHAGEF